MARAVFSIVDIDGIRSSVEKLSEISSSVCEQNRVTIREDKIASIREMEFKARLALLKSVQLLCALNTLIEDNGK